MFVKEIFCCAFCIFCYCKVFCQSFITKFVENKNIQWAGYVIDTAHFRDPNLSLLLRNRLERDEIKVFVPYFFGWHDTHIKKNNINYITKDSLFDHPTHRNSYIPLYDSVGNLMEASPDKRTDLFSASRFNDQVNDMIEFEQVIYIQSGKLKNFISLVSPKFSVVTTQGIYLGKTNLFSTALNTKKSFNKKIRKKAISLGRTESRYLLNNSGIIPLKQLYGQHLLQAIWPYFANAGYEIIRLDSSIKISFKELETIDLGYEMLHVPVYDAEGNMTKATALASPVDASMFSAISIAREWFYSQEKNILICDISSLKLYYSKIDTLTGSVAELPIIKIDIR